MAANDYWEYCDQAKAALAKRDYKGAKSWYEQALRARPDSFDARYGLANVSLIMRDFAGAMQYFESALEIAPRHTGATINLGAIHSMQGRYEDAITYLRRAIQIDASNGDAYYNLGIAYKNLGRLELAVEAYQQAVKLNPKFIDPMINLANIYVEMERYEKAADYYRRALEVDSNEPKAREGLRRVDHLQSRKKAESKAAGNVSFGDSESVQAVEDPLGSDPRYDKELDRLLEGKVLVQMYENAEKARDDADNWLARNRELTEAIRGVNKNVAANAAPEELLGSLSILKTATRAFTTLRAAFGAKLNAVKQLRDELMDGSTDEGRIRRLEREVRDLREIVARLTDSVGEGMMSRLEE